MLINDMFEIYYCFIIKDKSLYKHVLYNLDKKLHHSQVLLLIIIRIADHIIYSLVGLYELHIVLIYGHYARTLWTKT
jgi:hypothetical protein